MQAKYSFRNSKNVVYYLHQKDEELPGIGKTAIHYFAREIKEGVLDSVPEGF